MHIEYPACRSREWHSTQDHLMEEAVRLCIRDFEMQTQKLQGLIEEARQHKLIMGAQRHEQEAISRSLYECAFGLEQEGPRTQEDQVNLQRSSSFLQSCRQAVSPFFRCFLDGALNRIFTFADHSTSV